MTGKAANHRKANAILFRKEKASHTKNTDAGQPRKWGDYCADILQWKETRFSVVRGFPHPCESKNGVRGGYRLSMACSDTPQFPLRPKRGPRTFLWPSKSAIITIKWEYPKFCVTRQNGVNRAKICARGRGMCTAPFTVILAAAKPHVKVPLI